MTATVAWGVADFYGAKVSKRLGGYRGALLVSIIAVLAYGVVFGLFFRSYIRTELAPMLYAISGGAIFALALASFYKGLEIGPVSIVSPLGSLYPLVTMLLLVIVFHNHLSVRQELGIGVVVLGVLAASGLFERAKSGRSLRLGPFLGLLAALGWGVNFALIAQAIDKIGWQFATLVQ